MPDLFCNSLQPIDIIIVSCIVEGIIHSSVCFVYNLMYWYHWLLTFNNGLSIIKNNPWQNHKDMLQCIIKSKEDQV